MINKLVRALFRDKNLAIMSRKSKSSSSDGPPAKVTRHWRLGLLETMKDPDSIMEEDDRVIVIKDKYPKAQHHYLVLPKEDIASIKDVKKEHEELLKHMEMIGRKVADEYKDREFIVGYHAVPSMHRLHLHVISTDFDSPSLKTKHHWNSFTTPYFRPSESVREELENHGRIKQMSTVDSEKLLTTELKCNKCSFKPKTMPELKRHLKTHLPQE